MADVPSSKPDASPPDEGSAARAPGDPAAEAERALRSVEEAMKVMNDAAAGAAGGSRPEIPDFAPSSGERPAAAAMSLLDDVALRVRIELGRTRMYVEDVLRLNPDSIIELDKAAGDPVDIYVNDRYVARGEVLVLNENFCVRVSEILQPGAPFT
jgi:flagellar motor switch protein FliN/FliY